MYVAEALHLRQTGRRERREREGRRRKERERERERETRDQVLPSKHGTLSYFL
jgi:hypothetical protein